MLLSAVIVSIMVMSAAGVVTSVQNQRYDASSMGYYVNMIEDEADRVDLSNPNERQEFEQILNYINTYDVQSDYWNNRHCYNVTLLSASTEVNLNCIGGPEKNVRAMALGYNSRQSEGGSAPIPPGKGASSYGGLYNIETDEWILNAGRSYNIAVLDTETGEWVRKENYDVYGDASEAEDMADYLNSLPDDGSRRVYIVSADEPRNNRLSNGLEKAMYRLGASEEVFGSDEFETRSAYILVGKPGIGEGNAYREYYKGSRSHSPDAWIDRDIPVDY
jgi:hypothetical protein